jgi:hypothetical protein
MADPTTPIADPTTPTADPTTPTHPTTSGEDVFSDDVVGSIGLYKRAARSSRENSALVVIEAGRARGITALEEVRTRLAIRFSSVSDVSSLSDTSEISDISHDDGLSPFDTDEIAAEIRLQDTSKACGADGIHIRLIKILASEPTFLDALVLLYSTCLTSGRTPSAWNETLVCLLIKDESLPIDIDDVRPITLTSIVRKVFERLLLSRFDLSGRASVHTLQAGFIHPPSLALHYCVWKVTNT